MTNFSNCNLKIKFKFGYCNNKFFNVAIKYKDSVTSIFPTQHDEEFIAVYENTIQLPTDIEIYFSEKDINQDTIVDDIGNIKEDMYVQIEEISLDSVKLNSKYLHQKISIVTENNDVHTTSYIGFNGKITLNFHENNVFFQVLTANK